MNEEPAPTTQLIIFLPFLRLEKAYGVAGVEFLPFRDGDDKMPAVLETAAASLTIILKGYIDRHGKPFDNCVVATIPGRGWDLEESDHSNVLWAASLLFLASWASNEYFPTHPGPYVNSSSFRVVGQKFTGPTPGYISVVSRRRDGTSWDGGYEHGEFKFNIPVQCSISDPVDVDEKLLAGLDKAVGDDWLIVDRLRSALPFVSLANTDDDLMTPTAEAILMGSAFEQLLAGDASSYKLGRKFGALFGRCGSVTVADAMKVRPDIEIDTSDPKRAEAQPKWYVHRKWIEELYDLRSKVVHKGHDAGDWGWRAYEHLVMAAFVFPLVVKALLAHDGYYHASDDDEDRCCAVDWLLATTDWAQRPPHGGPTRWQTVVGEVKQVKQSERIFKEMQELLAKQAGGNDPESPAEGSGGGAQ